MRARHATSRWLGWPGTGLGRLSLWLLGAFALFIFVMQLAIATGQRGGETFFDNPWLAIPALIAMSSGVAAGAAALVAIIRDGERSLATFVAAVIGVLVALFLVGELAFPH